MKKRNKKYNPNKPAINPVRKFQLIGEAQEENRMLELWQLMNGKTENDAPEIGHLLKFTKGDLVIAMRKNLIDEQQSFHIVSRIHAVNKETGEEVDVDFQLATATTMHLWQFLGDVDSDIYVEDGGFKKKWLGFNSKLEKYLESIEGDFEVVTNHCCLTRFSTFKSFRHEMEFKAHKLMLVGQGLGVAA